MKNKIIKNSLRTIILCFPRFLSLLIMSMLGVFVFIGLQSTAPDMLTTLDNFLDNSYSYDMRIISTMGLTKDDITYLNNLDYIESVEGAHTKDVLININDESIVIQVLSMPNEINKLKLVSGKFPENKQEIVVEQNLIKNYSKKIGDTIYIDNENLSSKEFTIVGIVESPLYYNNVGINPNRGSTSIGSGTINYYTYVLEDEFKEDYYTVIYMTLKGSRKEETASNKYLEIIDNGKENLNQIKEEREYIRYQSIYNEAKSNLEEKEIEIRKELSKAKNNLDNAHKKLNNFKKNLDNAYSKLSNFKKELEIAKTNINNAKKQYIGILNTYQINENEIPIVIEEIKNNIDNLKNYLENIESNSEDYILINSQLDILEKKLVEFTKLQNTKQTLETSENIYNKNLDIYNKSYSTYKTNYNLYEKNFKKYNSSLKEYEKNKNKFEKEIDDAKKELEKIEKPKWYIYDRSDYMTYLEYIDDTKSLSNLSKVFPILFFSVAILVSLISMNRMVEDDRCEIGTLKSLGFSNKKIMTKYILFSVLATLIGTIIGYILGNIIIPLIIFSIYKILFDLPPLTINWDIKMAIFGFLLSTICVCGTTIFTVLKVLKEKPSSLMRPKAPKNGKRVFLENISSIWNRMKFSNKVTIRNIFRYKKRVIATISGIAGCTALILCGFGIRDAIVDLTDMQYGKTFKFDALSYINSIDDDIEKSIFSNEFIKDYTLVTNISSKIDKTSTNIFVVNNKLDLEKVVNLTNISNQKVTLENGKVLITDKLADLKGYKIGDKIEVTDINGKSYTFIIGDIVKNYIEHYIYVDKDTFINAGGKIKENIAYLDLKEMNDNERNELTNILLENDEVINVTYIETLKLSVSNMLKSLDKVVFILILLASCLAFVVLYNLSNINIQERKREIATLKVLGFYDYEVDNYITKENILLTIIGIALGLFIGYFLTTGVISSVEIEKARFIHNISILSYILAAVISTIFTIIVNIITHFSLKKIDMISSLKNVE